MVKQTKISLALTGTSGLIGHHLLGVLVKDEGIGKIVAIDRERPRLKNPKILFIKTDITDDDSVGTVVGALKRFGCKTLVHTALPAQPTRDAEYQHELQTIGTMNILLASEAANLAKLILSSTTDVYGAWPDNPGFIPEDHSPRGGPHSTFIRDKIDAERQFLRFQGRFPRKVITILRTTTILGKGVFNLKTNFLFQPTVPTILGFDPLMQFIHISDVIRLFLLVIFKNFSGVFNISGEGVLPLSRVIEMAGKVNLPIPELLLSTAANVLWYLNAGPAPAGHVNYLKYAIIANIEKMKKVIKFEPVYSSEEAILSMRKIEIKTKAGA